MDIIDAAEHFAEDAEAVGEAGTEECVFETAEPCTEGPVHYGECCSFGAP